jgi:hypothetical protein
MAVPTERLIRAKGSAVAPAPHMHASQNEKAARQLGSLFFQGRIVLTEIKPSKLSGEIL